jgi:hypothetical protein
MARLAHDETRHVVQIAALMARRGQPASYDHGDDCGAARPDPHARARPPARPPAGVRDHRGPLRRAARPARRRARRSEGPRAVRQPHRLPWHPTSDTLRERYFRSGPPDRRCCAECGQVDQAFDHWWLMLAADKRLQRRAAISPPRFRAESETEQLTAIKVVQPDAIPYDGKYPFGEPARLPSVSCMADFVSSGDDALYYMHLTVIWFQRDDAFPLSRKPTRRCAPSTGRPSRSKRRCSSAATCSSASSSAIAAQRAGDRADVAPVRRESVDQPGAELGIGGGPRGQTRCGWRGRRRHIVESDGATARGAADWGSFARDAHVCASGPRQTASPLPAGDPDQGWPGRHSAAINAWACRRNQRDPA